MAYKVDKKACSAARLFCCYTEIHGRQTMEEIRRKIKREENGKKRKNRWHGHVVQAVVSVTGRTSVAVKAERLRGGVCNAVRSRTALILILKRKFVFGRR